MRIKKQADKGDNETLSYQCSLHSRQQSNGSRLLTTSDIIKKILLCGYCVLLTSCWNTVIVLPSVTVGEIWKSLNLWWTYETLLLTFLDHPVRLHVGYVYHTVSFTTNWMPPVWLGVTTLYTGQENSRLVDELAEVLTSAYSVYIHYM